MRTSGDAGVRKSIGSRERVGPVFSLFVGRSPSSASSMSDNFLLVADDGRVDDALDTSLEDRNPLDRERGSAAKIGERTWSSERVRPGTSSLNRFQALEAYLGASEGSGRRGLELGTRTFPEDGGGMGKYLDVADASRDCAGGTTAALFALAVQDAGVGEAEWLKSAFCCFWTFLNLSCSSAAFCNGARRPQRAGQRTVAHQQLIHEYTDPSSSSIRSKRHRQRCPEWTAERESKGRGRGRRAGVGGGGQGAGMLLMWLQSESQTAVAAGRSATALRAWFGCHASIRVAYEHSGHTLSTDEVIHVNGYHHS